MFVFRKIWRALFSWNTRFEIHPSALVPKNCLSSSIKQSKNYPSTYYNTFLRCLSVKNHSNYIFCQFRFFAYGLYLQVKTHNPRKVSESFICCAIINIISNLFSADLKVDFSLLIDVIQKHNNNFKKSTKFSIFWNLVSENVRLKTLIKC